MLHWLLRLQPTRSSVSWHTSASTPVRLLPARYVLNSSTGEKERVGRIVRLQADKREDVTEVGTGDIAAIVGLKGTTTGNTLCDPTHPIILESIDFPGSASIYRYRAKDQSRPRKDELGASDDLPKRTRRSVYALMKRLARPSSRGMGELHLEIIVDRMKREFSVEANIGQPQVAYRETVRKDAVEVQGKFVRQSGGRGQYGDVWLRISQNEAGKGFEFINSIKGGVVPSEYIPAVRKGVEEAMSNGVIAGYPVVDIKAELYDGSYHEVDSSEMAFNIAGSMALQEGVKKANPTLLEPVMKVVVVTPEEFMGDVIGDLNSKRGRIEAWKTFLWASKRSLPSYRSVRCSATRLTSAARPKAAPAPAWSLTTTPTFHQTSQRPSSPKTPSSSLMIWLHPYIRCMLETVI